MKTYKKALSLILTLIILLTSIPFVTTSVSTSSEISVGDTIVLGSYNGEPISWICVDIDDNGPLMLSEKVLCTKEYDAAGTSSTYHTDSWGYIRKKYGSNCWYDSNIRQWLNSNESYVSWSHCPPSYSNEGGFLTNFTTDELSVVKRTTRLVNVITYESKRSGYCEGGNKDTVVNEIYKSTFPATNYYYDYIEDSFFLLSAVQFNNIYKSNPDFLKASTKYFTCVTSGNNSNCFEWVASVQANKTSLEISTNAYMKLGIRPAFYLDSSAWYERNFIDGYNLGEETYSFINYSDEDSPVGHCFGMSITSAGYYLGYMDPVDVGVNSSSEIYTIADNLIIRIPICYYQNMQGSLRDQAIVAGNTKLNIFNKTNVKSDWNEIIDYIKDHSYDDKGLLQILYFFDGGGHAINFLRYDSANDQIYVYDNNDPYNEHTLKLNADDTVTTPFGPATSIALVHIPTYFNSISSKEVVDRIIRNSIYFYKGDVLIMGEGTAYVMATDNTVGEYYVYELAEGQSTVKIVPLVDNATFKYMEQEYTFDEINDNTYAELKLSLSEEDTPEFKIINAHEDETTTESDTTDEPTTEESSSELDITNEPTTDEPSTNETSTEPESPDDTTDSCSHLCHKSGFMGFIWKIIRFFLKLFKSQPICDCGIAHY